MRQTDDGSIEPHREVHEPAIARSRGRPQQVPAEIGEPVTVMVTRRVEQRLGRPLDERVDDRAAHGLGIGRDGGTAAVGLLGEQRNAGQRGGGVPSFVHAEDVRGIGGRHAAERDDAAPHQRVERARLGLRFKQEVERDRTGREPIEERRLAPTRVAGDAIATVDTQREPAGLAAAARRGALPIECFRHQVRVLDRQQRERHEPAGANQQPLVESRADPLARPSHLAVAPEPDGAHRHRFHHRAKSPHCGAVGVESRPAVLEQCIVGRRSSISDTIASRSSVRWEAPTRLAAGPERIVSTGFSRATSAPTSAPSPRTTIIGAQTPNASNDRSAASSKR